MKPRSMDGLAETLVRLGGMTRGLKDSGLQEGASTRLLIHAGKLIKSGIPPQGCLPDRHRRITDR